MASERQPGMVVDGVEHRPVKAPKWILANFGVERICSCCNGDWPCRTVVVAALKGAVRKLREKLTEPQEAQAVRMHEALDAIANAGQPCPNCNADYPGEPCPYGCEHGWIPSKRAGQRRFLTCRKEPAILYHGTSREALPGILRRGLTPSRPGWCVYLSPNEDVARGFGAGVLLRVDVPRRVALSAFENCEEWEVLCWGRIPPDRIKVLEG